MKYIICCFIALLGLHAVGWSMFQQENDSFSNRLERASDANISASQKIPSDPYGAINEAENALRIVDQIKSNGYMIEGRISTVSRDHVSYSEIQSNYILSKAYEVLEEYGKAVKYMQTALKIAEKYQFTDYADQLRVELNGLRIQETNSKKGLGKIFLEAKRAVEDVIRNEDFQAFTGDLGKVQMDIHESRAITFENKLEFDKAINNYLLALEVADRLNDTLRINDYQNKVAKLKLRKGDIQDAQVFTEEIPFEEIVELENIEEEEERQFNPLLPNTSSNLESEPLPEFNEVPTRRSRRKFVEANVKSRKPEYEGYKLLSEELKAKGDYEGALNALNEYAVKTSQMQAELRRRWEDSIRTSQRIDSTRRVIDSLKIENRDGELALREKNYLIQQKKRQLSYIVLGGAGFVAIALLLYLLFMFQRRANKKLKQAYTKLNEAHEQLKSTQAQLVESEKMASLGQLTAGIAHEINNPVNFISGNISPLKRDFADVLELLEQYEQLIVESMDSTDSKDLIANLKNTYDYPFIKEEINELISGVEEGASRTAEIVKGLRNFARVDEDMPKKYDIRIGLDSTLALLKHKIDDINIVKEYHDVPEILCLPGKLNQVFMNILTNAIQAMPEGGAIKISTEAMTLPTHQQVSQSPTHVRIKISDEGDGIPEEVKSRIFDPFFTTKDVGDGTGLGLSISKNIIEKHKGTIKAQDNVPKGTVIDICLPLEGIESALAERKKYRSNPQEKQQLPKS